jgi:hypothetical protein
MFNFKENEIQKGGRSIIMTEQWREDEEYLSYVEDLLETDAVQKLANYTQHVHSTRLEHSLSVSYYSARALFAVWSHRSAAGSILATSDLAS